MYFNKEDILEKEHECLCHVVLGEQINDFVMGQVNGILRVIGDLLREKEDD